MSDTYVKYDGTWFELGFAKMTLDDILLRSGAKTKTEVLQNALALYAAIIRIRELGGVIIVKGEENELSLWRQVLKDIR